MTDKPLPITKDKALEVLQNLGRDIYKFRLMYIVDKLENDMGDILSQNIDCMDKINFIIDKKFSPEEYEGYLKVCLKPYAYSDTLLSDISENTLNFSSYINEGLSRLMNIESEHERCNQFRKLEGMEEI